MGPLELRLGPFAPAMLAFASPPPNLLAMVDLQVVQTGI
jgi:hypothetical protein